MDLHHLLQLAWNACTVITAILLVLTAITMTASICLSYLSNRSGYRIGSTLWFEYRAEELQNLLVIFALAAGVVAIAIVLTQTNVAC